MIQRLVRAAGPLFLDSLGVIAFAALLAMGVSLVAATIAAVVLACALVAWDLVRGRPIPPLQWLSVALVLISAGAALFTGDPRFVMVKPTVIYIAIGTAMLKRGWMLRYIAADDIGYVSDWMVRFGYVWAALMFATGIANLVVALAFTAWWPAFIGIFPLASKLTLFAVQFATVHAIGRTRARRERHGQGPLEALT